MSEEAIEYKGEKILPRKTHPNCPYCNVPMERTEEFWVCPKNDKHKLFLTFGAKIVEEE